MYHTSGGVLGPGAALTAGASVVLRERFSASTFWDDIVRHDCTVFLYIGELCRYLLNSPPHPQETKHKLRLACGNGLRPDIWADFQQRFRIPKILEWYAATEGNCVFFNFDGKIGAVGRIPKWMKRQFFVEIVRFDIDSEQPVRGADGFCIKCAPGEVGEAISKIVNDPKRPSQRFEGYADPGATEKKILRDVFEKGDRWFRTGDLMRKDALGYYYFVDRIGDTFRWKGENVATSEVLGGDHGLPRHQGGQRLWRARAGRRGPRRNGGAGGRTDELDLDGFHRHVARAACRPMRGRCSCASQREIDATSTFKQRKLDLVKQGFDPAATGDPIYFLHPELQTYVRLDSGALWRHLRGQGAALSSDERHQPGGRRRVLARGRSGKMVQEGRGVRPRDRRALRRASCGSGGGATGRLGEDAGGRAGAHPPPRPVLPQLFRGIAEGLRAGRARRARSRSRRSTPASTRQVGPEHSARSSTCRSCIRNRSPTRSAASRSPTAFAARTAALCARASRAIIRRFGRFPHRNAILGRHMTPAEQAFLDGGGFGGLSRLKLNPALISAAGRRRMYSLTECR